MATRRDVVMRPASTMANAALRRRALTMSVDAMAAGATVLLPPPELCGPFVPTPHSRQAPCPSCRQLTNLPAREPCLRARLAAG